MNKKLGIIFICSLLLLQACSPFGRNKEKFVEEELGEEHTLEVSPKVETKENYYRSVLYDGSYPHGEARGFTTDVVYNRLDLEHLEIGLTNIAKEYFNPDKYFFREGQIIKKDELNRWLMRYDNTKDSEGNPKNPLGLNPALGNGETRKEQEENSPRYISHILEHNYLVEGDNGLELAGIVIGISLYREYHFRIEDEQGRYYFYSVELDLEEVEQAGKEAAKKVVERIRSNDREEGKYKNVPIVVALFQEEKRDAVLPGNFIAKAVAEANSTSLDRWQKINEKYYLFPSQDAVNNQRNDSDRFNKLQEEINEFFDNYVGIVGTGYYIDEQLQELKIEVPIRYYGKTEIIALSQFIADQVTQRFPDHLKIYVYITSTGGNEAIIVKNPKEEPFVHIYR